MPTEVVTVVNTVFPSEQARRLLPAKGFDVVDIRCGVSCRPYRKSLSGHIQTLGRVMRPADGKDYALWLDHGGNYVRFGDDTRAFFQNGVNDLSEQDLDNRVRKDKDENGGELRVPAVPLPDGPGRHDLPLVRLGAAETTQRRLPRARPAHRVRAGP